ncbi:MAG: hypothetical protein ACHQ7M_11270 [Chloroflexota bacterium]
MVAPPAAALLSSGLEPLVAGFNRNASAIQTMSLKLQLTARAGKKKYNRIGAFLLTRKPAGIRLWGTVPLLGRLFDMASNGTEFELSIPSRSKFIEGQNDVIPEHVSNPFELLRPQIILNALLINPVASTEQIALDPSAGPGTYDVLVLQTSADSFDHLARRITFSRLDLLPHRQVLYDRDGVHQTIATYDHFTVRNNVPIPTDITISRPLEGYALHLQLDPSGIVLNQPFTDPNTFQLTPPPGATVIKLSAAGSQPAKVGQR